MTQEVSEKYDRLILDRETFFTNQKRKRFRFYKLNGCAQKTYRRKITFYEIKQKIDNVLKSKTTIMTVDFCAEESASIKSFAIKKNDQIKVTTRFLSRKMLMFAKLSLMSFIYEMLETFCFPDKKIQENF